MSDSKTNGNRPPLVNLNQADTLLLGIGNSGRGDDGLGWAFLEAIQKRNFFRGVVEYRYQLQVEDASLMSHFRQVVFIDAFKGELKNGFQWKACFPAPDFAFSTHVLVPETLLYLCQQLYDHCPLAFTLLIQGKDWGLMQGLSAAGKCNLQKAEQYLFLF